MPIRDVGTIGTWQTARMFAAARKARHRRLEARPVQQGPSPFARLATQWKQTLDGAVQQLAASKEAAEVLALRSVEDVVRRLEAAGLGQRSPMLASVTSSALDQPAFLPSKGRPIKQGALPAGPSTPEKEDGSGDDEPLDQRILISEVDIVGVDGELKEIAKNALTIKPNFAYTLQEVQEDTKRMFGTGYFQSVVPHAEDTRDGVKLTLQIEPNAVLRELSAVGANVLPQRVIQDAFHNMYGRTMNHNHLAAAVAKLNRWYEDNGVMGQVLDVYATNNEGIELRVAEVVVNRINLRYVDRKTGEVREEGKTRPEVILRHLTTRPGQVYNLNQAKKDIDAVYGMGIFEDISIRPAPSQGSTMQDPRVDLELEIKEKNTRGVSAGGGVSTSGVMEGAVPGFVGRLAFSDRNLFGTGQKLVAEVDVGQARGDMQHMLSDLTYRVAHTDPWVRGDQYRTSRTLSADYGKTSTAAIHGMAQDEEPEGGGPAGAGSGVDGVYVQRTVAKLEWGRPLSTGLQGHLGLTWQQAQCVNDSGVQLLQDNYGSQMTFTDSGRDTLALGLLRVAYNSPSGDSHALVSMEQAVPIRQDYLNFNRLAVRAERALPLGPASLWLSAKGGMIIGDLPPYEAFAIGGTNSVRGYNEGAVGTGRKHVTGTAELRVPLFKPLEAVLFADGGSDLDSGATVPGDPAGRRQKPGRGYGAGAGVRVDTPLGPLRLEYAWNDRGQRRFHLGIGHG